MDFLTELSLILFLTFISKGHTWTVSVTRHVNVTSGSNANIQCTFSYPKVNDTDKAEIFWKIWSKEKMDIKDQDKNLFIFHKDKSLIIEKYKGRTQLTGMVDEGNCSLKIQNVTENEPKIYLRVRALKDNYSFVQDYVSISVSGAAPIITDPNIQLTTSPPNTTTNNTAMYIAIFVSLAAALIIIIVATGIVCFKKHRSLTRQESSYYVNFKVSSVPAKREPSLKKQDSKELPEQKVIDDPVYINLEVHPGQMDQSAHADNVYANVDYTA